MRSENKRRDTKAASLPWQTFITAQESNIIHHEQTASRQQQQLKTQKHHKHFHVHTTAPAHLCVCVCVCVCVCASVREQASGFMGQEVFVFLQLR